MENIIKTNEPHIRISYQNIEGFHPFSCSFTPQYRKPFLAGVTIKDGQPYFKVVPWIGKGDAIIAEFTNLDTGKTHIQELIMDNVAFNVSLMNKQNVGKPIELGRFWFDDGETGLDREYDKPIQDWWKSPITELTNDMEFIGQLNFFTDTEVPELFTNFLELRNPRPNLFNKGIHSPMSNICSPKVGITSTR